MKVHRDKKNSSGALACDYLSSTGEIDRALVAALFQTEEGRVAALEA